VRPDIWGAYLTQQHTLIPTDFWISPDYETAGSEPLQDRYANKMIWIFGRIINELAELGPAMRRDPKLIHESSTLALTQLWDELDDWKAACPASVQSLIELEPSKSDAFPFILYGNSSASRIAHLILHSSNVR
jgi:hypothetical protein